MMRIIDGLYLGNREDARDLARLREQGITHVVNCTAELPNYHDGSFEYLALGLGDPDPAFRDCLADACAFIDAARKEGAVLVHCFAAISRSPSTVLAYLCHHQKWTLEEAARHLSGVVWTDPDLLFIKQLLEQYGGEVSDRNLERLSFVLSGRRWGPDEEYDSP
jgi:hypothetical protein